MRDEIYILFFTLKILSDSVKNNHLAAITIHSIYQNQVLVAVVYLLQPLYSCLLFSLWRACPAKTITTTNLPALTYCSCQTYFTFFSFCILSCCRLTSLTCSSAIALSFERKTQIINHGYHRQHFSKFPDFPRLFPDKNKISLIK